MRQRSEHAGALPTRRPIFVSSNARRPGRLRRALPAALVVAAALAALIVPKALAWILAVAGVAVLLRAALGLLRNRR
jgi:hypothetical protein